jgi:anti-sigma factor RsiW
VTCTQFLASLDDLLDNSVSAEMRAELEAHMHGCEHCEVTLNTTRKTIEIYRFTICPAAFATASTPPSWLAAKRAAEPSSSPSFIHHDLGAPSLRRSERSAAESKNLRFVFRSQGWKTANLYSLRRALADCLAALLCSGSRPAA